MAVKFPIAIVVEALERVSGPMRKARAKVEEVLAPLKKVKAGFGEFVSASGIDEVAKGLGGVASAAANVGRELAAAALKAGAIVTAVGGALFLVTKSYAQAGESAAAAADKIGVSIEALQELRYAASLSNVEQGALDDGLLQLTRRVGLVAQGNKQAAVGFERLGINVHKADGRLRGAEELLGVIADRLNALDDPMKRVALAQELFGRGGAAMVPLLLEGSASIRRMRDEARELGIVLSDKAAREGDAFMDGLTRMQAVLDGVRNTIGAALLPVVQDLVEELARFVRENRPQIQALAQALAEQLPVALEQVRQGLAVLWAAAQPVVAVFKLAVDVLGPVPVVLGVLAAVILAGVVPAMVALVASFYTLGTAIATTPAGWILLIIAAVVAAVVGLVVGIVALARNWDKVWGWIKDTAARVWGWIEEHLDFLPVVALIKNWDTVRAFFGVMWARIVGYFSAAWEWIKEWWPLFLGPIGLVIKHWTAVRDFFVGLWDTIRGLFDQGVAFIAQKVLAIVDLLPDWMKEGLGLKAELAAPRASAPGAGVGGGTKAEAAVRVEFANAPRGTRVDGQANTGVELDLSTGYNLATP